MNQSPDQICQIAVLIPAAGHGQRFGSATNKLHAILDGKPIWQHAVEAFADSTRVRRIIMALSPADIEIVAAAVSQFPDQIVTSARGNSHVDAAPIDLVLGGQTRAASVAAMLSHLRDLDDPAIRWVAVHDAARPLLTSTDRDAVFEAAIKTGAAFLGTPINASIHRRIGPTTQAISRDELFAAATPQVFALETFIAAHQRHRGRDVTDDAALVQRIGIDVTVVPGRSDNLKITYPEDLEIAQSLIQTIKANQ